MTDGILGVLSVCQPIPESLSFLLTAGTNILWPAGSRRLCLYLSVINGSDVFIPWAVH